MQHTCAGKPTILFFVPLWSNFGHFAYPLALHLKMQYNVVFLHSTWMVYRETNFPDLSQDDIDTVSLKELKTFSLVRALEKVKPACIIVHDKGWPQERALLKAAHHLNIASIHIQHGMVSDIGRQKTHGFARRARTEFMKTVRTMRVYNATMMSIGFKTWLTSLAMQVRLVVNPMDYCFNWRKEVVADKACIIGERDRRYFVEKEGYEERQLVPFGAPQFEGAYGAKVTKSPLKRLLIISQPLYEDHWLPGGLEAKRKHMEEIIAASPFKVAIKPHPRENEQWYRDNFPAEKLHVFPSDLDINDAIMECSHVIGYFSTALVNALILKRPVGIIRWVDDQGYVLNMDKDGVASSLSCPSDLARFLEEPGGGHEVFLYAFSENTGQVLHQVIERLMTEA